MEATPSIDFEKNSMASKLDLTNKKLKTLKGISKCKALTWLDVSNNSLETLQWIKKLKKLNVLKASNNDIATVTHLSELSELKALILNNNKLQCIKGIECLPSLNALVLSHNEIEAIDVSSLSHLSKLSLSHNKLQAVPDLKTLSNLKELRLNDNKIESIPESIVECKRLKLLDLGNNEISDFGFLEMLGKIEIENLNLKGNKICSDEDYEEKVVNKLPQLKVLDGRRLSGFVAFGKRQVAIKVKELESKSKGDSKKEENSGHHASANPIESSSQKSRQDVASEKQSPVKEKRVRTGGFVSKFTIEKKESQETKLERNKKKKKSKGSNYEKEAKLSFAKEGAESKVSQCSPVMEIDGSEKGGKMCKEDIADSDEMDDTWKPTKAKSKHDSKGLAKKSREKNKRKRKHEISGDIADTESEVDPIASNVGVKKRLEQHLSKESSKKPKDRCKSRLETEAEIRRDGGLIRVEDGVEKGDGISVEEENCSNKNNSKQQKDKRKRKLQQEKDTEDCYGSEFCATNSVEVVGSKTDSECNNMELLMTRESMVESTSDFTNGAAEQIIKKLTKRKANKQPVVIMNSNTEAKSKKLKKKKLNPRAELDPSNKSKREKPKAGMKTISKSAMKIDSRSGVVAVELLSKKAKTGREADAIEFSMIGKGSEFGTGDATAW